MREYVFPRFEKVGGAALSEGGMTLRDWFAWQALAGYISATPSEMTAEQFLEWPKRAATNSYAIADAMLEARKK